MDWISGAVWGASVIVVVCVAWKAGTEWRARVNAEGEAEREWKSRIELVVDHLSSCVVGYAQLDYRRNPGGREGVDWHSHHSRLSKLERAVNPPRRRSTDKKKGAK
jgi:hypothetical protein